MSITIDLNDALVQQAEQYARQHGQSLAALVEDYLRQVVQQPAKPLAPAVQELYGTCRCQPTSTTRRSATRWPVDALFLSRYQRGF